MRGRSRLAGAIAVAVVVLSACGGNDNGGAVGGVAPTRAAPGPEGALRAQVPAPVAATGVLRVGAAVGRAPLLFYGTGTTQAEGLEYDLLQGIGRQLGLRVQLVDLPYPQVGSELLAHHADVLMSSFADLKSFESAGVDVVDYLTGRTAIVVRHGDPNRPRAADALCGRTVGVLGGSAQQVASTTVVDACKRSGRPVPALRVGTDDSALIKAIAAGQLDAVLDDAVVAQYDAQLSTGKATLDVIGDPFDPIPYGIGIAKDNAPLRDAVQAALRALIADGTYDAALAKWGGDQSALRTAAINAGP
ncbi:MAG: ABC transporter substrate-binding protein [Acidimicrobiales bacterium]